MHEAARGGLEGKEAAMADEAYCVKCREKRKFEGQVLR